MPILTEAGLLTDLLVGGGGLERAFGAVLEKFVLMGLVKPGLASGTLG